MELIDTFLKQTKKQFEFNSLKNIFDIATNLSFSESTKDFIKKHKTYLFDLNQDMKEYIFSYCVSNFISTFYEYYPYLHFKNKDYIEIRKIYELLYNEIKNCEDVEILEKNHYERIRNFIAKNNKEFVLNSLNNKIPKITYSEYSAEFQINLLNINLSSLKQPILDIGCGKNYNLVKYLNSLNFQALGIDRLIEDSKFTFGKDFLEFDYLEASWGTIISNLSFTSHFINHYLLKDDQDIEYAKTYMKILKALKKGGSFIYTPSVPFIEELLPVTQYEIRRNKIDKGLFYSKITKL